MIKTIHNSLVTVRNEIENNLDLDTLVRNDQFSRQCVDEVNASLSFIANIFNWNQGNITDDEANKCVKRIHEVGSLLDLYGMYLAQPNNPALSNNNILGLKITAVSSWLKTTLSPWIKGIGAALWAFLSQRLNVKSWKINGGIGGALGLINASLEIEFDPTIAQGNQANP